MILVDSSVWIDYFRGTQTPQCERLGTLTLLHADRDFEPFVTHLGLRSVF